MCGCEVIPLSGNAQRKTIVPANSTSTTQFVFGEERSLFQHPQTRKLNHQLKAHDAAPHRIE